MDCGRKKLPFAGYSVVKEPVETMSHQPMERRSRGELLSKLYFGSRVRETTYRLRRFRSPELAILTSLGTNPQARPAKSNALGRRNRVPNSTPILPAGHWAPAEAIKQVENTGLEPVTSWLQTRRSPS